MALRALFDQELDEMFIQVEHPVYCGNCMSRMSEISSHSFRCPKCGTIYDSIVEVA